MEIYCYKVGSTLVPANELDREKLKKLSPDQPLKLTIRRIRNYRFHKKYFALLKFLFDYWEPPENHCAEKNFDQFREDIIILAGFSKMYVRLDGSTRVKAKSISFGSMDETEFEQLYEKTIDVGIKHICHQYTGEMLREVVEMAEGFE